MEQAGKKVGLIGTIENSIGNVKIENAHRTTPESIELQRLLNRMSKENVEYVVMEVSSQALKLNRVAGCNFLVGAFTNFSKDHIGTNEHPDMEDYFNSKLKLFSMCKQSFINADDEKIFSKIDCFNNPITFSIDRNNTDFYSDSIKFDSTKTEFDVINNDEKEHFTINIPGKFTVYNCLTAISICKFLKIPDEYIDLGIKKAKVPGRSEIFENDLGLNIIIDYAHSPESLKNILMSTKAYTKNRLICVFGCGGNRDNSKRPIMGEISGEIADYTIITSDNPRGENPSDIVNQIEAGIKNVTQNYEIIVDRKKAMKKALQIAKTDDIIVLAGKGHETYQEINNEFIDFDERVVLKEIIEELKRG